MLKASLAGFVLTNLVIEIKTPNKPLYFYTKSYLNPSF